MARTSSDLKVFPILKTEIQVETFGSIDATKINNFLAGKYRGGYGVPFDLNELKDITGLNIHQYYCH